MFYIPIFSLGKLGLTPLPNEASAYFRLYLREVRATNYTTHRPWIYIMSQNALSPGRRVIDTNIETKVCWTKSDTYILISVSVIVQIISRPLRARLWGPRKCSEWKDLKCCEGDGDSRRRVCSLRAHRWPPSACGRKILKYTWAEIAASVLGARWRRCFFKSTRLLLLFLCRRSLLDFVY